MIALLLALTMIAAACGGDDGGEDDATSQGDTGEGGTGGTDPEGAEEGGVFRVDVLEAFNFTAGFDPSAEYLGSAWTIWSNLMIRTLMGYRHAPGDEGNEVIPDLAEGEPEVSEDGLEYTFTIRDGVEFGPPVSREIVADDIVYAFERIATPSIAAGYGFYYLPIIEGMQDFADGKAKTISGVEAVDDKTIKFTLTQPTGDFLYRVAMAATGPLPREVGECFEKSGEYGRYVISSGPYMIEGSDELDISGCKAMKPISGYNPTKHLMLVRNPNYDPATDDPEARSNYVDRFEFVINSNQNDIFNKIREGEIEGELAVPPPQVLREYFQSDELRDFLKSNPGDRTWYVNFDLSQPPFDDIHVRKAANLVMDKSALQLAWGGQIYGDVATSITPPDVLGADPPEDPYATENFAGDVEAAKEEMRQSKYDTDGDGMCDAPECSNLLHFTRNVAPWTKMVPVVEDSLSQIGIEVETREFADFYTPWQTVAKTSPVGSGAGWGKDYPDPSTFGGTLFHSTSIAATNNTNVPLVGITPEIAKTIKLPADRDISGIPSVDADIERCNELTDEERTECWVDLDEKLMTEVVPWVPYLWANNIDIISENVTRYQFDQFSGEMAYAHLAVDAEAQQE
ncbi:MAG TPA: ABC transporter substrate-binding protein [Actinomycetota bacterium]|nr:ABC transporter substrate-binding protein [Actinomycetota bacterium]